MDTSQKLTQRESSAINIMKAAAVLSVISAHVVCLDESSLFAKIVSSLYLLFGEVGVIIFFVIGGFLYKRAIGDCKEFWKKKFFRIILPWFFCSALTYILAFVRGRELSVFSYIQWVFGSGTWYYYISVYTIFLFAFKWFCKSDTALCFLMVLQLVLLALRTFNVPTTCTLGFFTDYLNPFHWAGYFSLGILIRKRRLDLMVRNKRGVLCVAGLMNLLSLWILYSNKLFTYFNIISALFCLSALVLVAASAYALASRKTAPYIEKVGTYSYCIYLLHLQIVQTVCSRIPNGAFKTLFAPFIGLAIMLIIITSGLFLCKKMSIGNKINVLVGL